MQLGLGGDARHGKLPMHLKSRTQPRNGSGAVWTHIHAIHRMKATDSLETRSTEGAIVIVMAASILAADLGSGDIQVEQLVQCGDSRLSAVHILELSVSATEVDGLAQFWWEA